MGGIEGISSIAAGWGGGVADGSRVSRSELGFVLNSTRGCTVPIHSVLDSAQVGKEGLCRDAGDLASPGGEICLPEDRECKAREGYCRPGQCPRGRLRFGRPPVAKPARPVL